MRLMFTSSFFSALIVVSVCSCEIDNDNLNIYDTKHKHDRQDTTSLDATFSCPATDGRFPHTTDCALFYECSSGHPHLMKCDKYKMYDDEKKQCITKCSVHCNRKEQNKKELDNDETYKCPIALGMFAHPTLCSKYYVCVQDIPTLFLCYGSTVFDTKNTECLERSQVDCGNRLDRDDFTTTESPTTVTPTSTVKITKPNTPPPTDCDENDLDCIMDKTGDVSDWFECPENGLFPHGGSKQLFIHCDNDKPFVQNCGDGTYFSPEHKVCMWIEKTDDK